MESIDSHPQIPHHPTNHNNRRLNARYVANEGDSRTSRFDIDIAAVRTTLLQL
jgi:hypothetical protein